MKGLLRFTLLVAFAFSLTENSHGQLYINEFMASNSTVLYNSEYDDYSDWIELYNSGSTQINLAGYYLSDDILEPLKWQFPGGITISAGGYLIIWADQQGLGTHTNFNLASEGEQILFFDNTGVLVDSLSFGLQKNDISYGRTTDGASEWSFFTKATPELANNTYPQNAIAPSPVFSPIAGFYTSAQVVSLSSSDASCQIRYTLDGTEPSVSSSLYSSQITVSTTTVIRAKTFGTNYQASAPVSQTYYINVPDYPFPVVSLSTTPANLWDNTTGIYVEGTNGVAGYCLDYPVNWNQDWERPVSIEYFDTNKTFILQQNAGTKIFGGCTRANAQKSLAIIARNEYGKNSLDYPFFGDKDLDKFKSIVLRNSGNDWGNTMFRDAYMQALVKDQMDVDYQAYQPVVVYINGEYWGIHGMREKLNEHYIANNYNIDLDKINLLEGNSSTIHGENTQYVALIEYLNSHNLSVDANYEYVTTQIDIEEYINYMITQIFVGNTDWPGNNIKYWRPTSNLGKFRWILFDLDFGFWLATEPSHNTLTFTLETNGPSWPNPAWSTFLFRKLMQNQEFKYQFAQQMDYHLNTTFSIPRMIELINEFEALLSPEMPRHIARWSQPWEYAAWENNINTMRNFAYQRPTYMRQYLASYIGISGTSKVIILNPDTASGLVAINGNPIYDTLFSGDFYQDLLINLSILPKNGYNLSHWATTPYTRQEDILISTGDTWKYLDNGTDQGTTWREKDFNDSAWASGAAQLGYGDNDETTTISYGSNQNNKYTTYYFRKTITVDLSSSPDELIARLMRDDGAVVYINGAEVICSNMPEGSISYNTFTPTYVGGEDESAYFEFNLDPALLDTGENVIAIEVHQCDLVSSDVSFDFELKAVSHIVGEPVMTYGYPLSFQPDGDILIIPVFEQSDIIDSLYINEFMCENKNSIMDNRGQFEDWIEIYNAGSKPVNIAGLYLTDSIGDPDMFVVPDGHPEQTTVQPYDFLVIWADDDTSQGPLHTNFKLDNDREQIGLIQIVNSVVNIIDSMEYGPQIADASSGSYPDGSKARMTFGIITPGAPNNNTPVSVVPVIAQRNATFYPNPTSGWLRIKLENGNNLNIADECRLEVYNITGQVRFSQNIQLMDGEEIELNLSSYNPGLYIIRLQTGSEVITGKVYKK